MKQVKPGDEITYGGKKVIVQAFRKDFSTKKHYIRFGDDGKDYPWPEPNADIEEAKVIEEQPEEQSEDILKELQDELSQEIEDKKKEEEEKKPKIKRVKKKSTKK